jgi:ABC-2 type transport system permease protein
MIRTFALMTLRSFKNRILRALRRMRQPRYLISFIVAVVYFWFMVFRRMAVSGKRSPIHMMTGDFAADLAGMVMLGIVLIAWALPDQAGGIEFSESEIAFLFPAPLSRGQILLYKVFRTQPRIVMSAAIMTVIGFRAGKFAGLWLLFTALSIYFMTVGLARARLKLAGVGFLIRLPAVLALGVLAGWALHTDLFDGHTPPVREALRSMQRGGTVVSPFDAPWTRAMLFIPRELASLVFPPGIVAFLAAFAIVAALTTALFFAAARLNVSYEDASIVLAQNKLQRSLRVQGQRVGGSITFRRFPPLFRLRASHRPEVAVLWKNLIASMRIASPWMIMMVLFAAGAVVATFTVTLPGIAAMCGSMMLALAGMFLFFGPRVFAQDLRLDLPRIEILKSFPISGERLLIAEMAAPLAVVTAIEMLFLAATSVIFRQIDEPHLAIVASPQFIIIGLLFAVPICGAQLLIHNAVPVLWPAWAMRSKEEPRGFAVTGQRLVLFAGNLVVLAIALLPAALLFIPAWWVTHRYFAGSSLGLALLIMPSVALMTAEVWVGMRLLGAQIDRIDITNETISA